MYVPNMCSLVFAGHQIRCVHVVFTFSTSAIRFGTIDYSSWFLFVDV